MLRGVPARRTLSAAVLGLLLLGASCDGEQTAAPEQAVADPVSGTTDASTGIDLTAVWCPMAPTGAQAAGAVQWEPADNAFDTAELIGLQLDAARARAATHGCEVTVSLEDGRGQPVPLEIDPTLIYVYTENEVVTAVEGVGGGL